MKLKDYLLLESENKDEDYSNITTFYVRKGSDTKDQKALRSKALNSPGKLTKELGIGTLNYQSDPIKNIYKVLSYMFQGPLNNEFKMIFQGLKVVKKGRTEGIVIKLKSDALSEKSIGDVRSARKDYAFWLWSAVIASNLSYNIFNKKSPSFLRVEGISGKDELLIYFSRNNWKKLN